MNTPRKAVLALLGLDLLCLFVVFNAAAYFRGSPLSEHVFLAPLIRPSILLLFAIYLIDGYNARTDMMSLDYTSQHAIALLAAMLATLLLTFAFNADGDDLQSSRAVIALSFIALVPMTLSYRRIVTMQAHATRGTHSLVFLGDQSSCRAFREECAKVGATQPVVYTVATEASVAPFGPEGEPPRLFADVLGEIEAGHLAVEAVILRESSRDLPSGVSRRLVELYFRGVPTFTLELFHQVFWRKIPLYRLNQTWLFQEGFQIAREPVFERLKRASDIGLAALGLVLAAPLIGLGALAVWLEDRGPVFFAQHRVGKNHHLFSAYKLRTMRPSDEAADPYTRPGDARITRVGKFLRETRLDELPQIWNVLRGDMSLIGPRAEWDRLVAGYERDIPCYHFRHLVKPGITGWAQVNYPYGANLEDTIRKLEYDLYYIRHFSFMLDASIVLKTIHIMLFGKGR